MMLRFGAKHVLVLAVAMMQAAPIPQAPPDSFIEVVKQPLLDHEKAEEQVVQEEPAPASHILEELTPVDRLLITKRLSVKSVMLLRVRKNRYLIRTPDHNLVYTVEEQNSWWGGYLCNGLRPFQLKVSNSLGTEVMRIDRPYAWTSRVLPCQLQRLQVFAPPGTRIGTIDQQWAPIRPVYLVRDDDGQQVFWIRGPRCTLSCFRDVQFHIMRPDGRQVGSTCKRWQGLVHAMFYAPIADRFGVAFDRDLTPTEKALLLAATLLFDYMYYDT